MEGDGEGFDQGGLLEAEFLGQGIEDLFGHDDEFSKGAVLAVVLAGDAQHAAVIAEVDLSQTAEFALAAEAGGVKGDALAGGAGDAGANVGDDARGFVAHDDWRAAAAGAAVQAVNIAATDAARLDSDEDFAGTGFGGRDIFKGEAIVFFEDESFHRLCPLDMGFVLGSLTQGGRDGKKFGEKAVW